MLRFPDICNQWGRDFIDQFIISVWGFFPDTKKPGSPRKIKDLVHPSILTWFTKKKLQIWFIPQS
jgi:hypothetical protein